MSIDHLDLNRPPDPHRRPTGSSPTRWVVAAATVVVVGALIAFWWMSRAQIDNAPPAPTNATEIAVKSNRPTRQQIDLPSLDNSDDVFRQLVSTLSKNPLIAKLLVNKALARKAVLAVEQIGDGKTPSDPLAALKPPTRVAIVGGGDSGRIDPMSYARWSGATASLVETDPGEAAQVYVTLKPLFDEAYRELGHPNGDFDAAIVRAINTLNDTPKVSGDPVLLRRPGYFEHADPQLRNILPVQKEMILIGPDNRQKVMNWLKRFAAALDLKVD
jgi:hypothetical protein